MRMPIAVVLMLTGGLSAVQAMPATLAPHRAVYEMSLKSASERSGIDGMVGRMVYEFSGSACTGYTANYRFVLRVQSGETSRLTDQQTTTHEDIRANTFRFSTRYYVDQKLESETAGEASRASDEIKVHLDKPGKADHVFPTALFPTEQTIEIIDRARKGDHFYESRVFDSSDNADEVMLTATVLGDQKKVDAAPLKAAGSKKDGMLPAGHVWPVAISYFSESSDGDALPVYSMSFNLFDNGVSTDLVMDYGDYAYEGKLTELEMLKAEPCAE